MMYFIFKKFFSNFFNEHFQKNLFRESQNNNSQKNALN